MTDVRRRMAGRLFRQCRLRILDLDDNPLTQKELAEEAGLSERTVQRIEAGEPVSNEYTILLLRALKRLGLNPDALRMLEDELNPIRIIDDLAPLDDEERWKIKRQLRIYMLAIPPPLPAFVMDEYWFTRTVNVYILALHRIEPKMLYVPELWHAVALKFKPELEMQQRRATSWEDYCLATVKEFRRGLELFEGTERYEKLMQWLQGLEGFKTLWNKAGDEPELEYKMRLLTSRPIPVHLDFEVQWWNELGGNAPVSRLLPAYWRSMWVPAAQSGNRELPEILQDMRLSETAERLGYDVRGEPFFFIEDYISQDRLRDIGGWIE